MSYADRATRWLDANTLGKLLSGLLVGAGIGTVVAGGGASLPAVGTVPAAALGAAGLAAGGLVYVAVDRHTDCDCGGDCSC